MFDKRKFIKPKPELIVFLNPLFILTENFGSHLVQHYLIMELLGLRRKMMLGGGKTWSKNIFYLGLECIFIFTELCSANFLQT